MVESPKKSRAPALVAWTLVLATGVAWPLVVWAGAVVVAAGTVAVGPEGWAGLAALGGLAGTLALAGLYLLTYRLFRLSGRGPMPDGPCQRTGTHLGRVYWFEFPEAPGHRWWTLDRRLAAEVRRRRLPPIPLVGLELTFGQPDDLPWGTHLAALGKTTLAWAVGAFAWLLWPLLGFLGGLVMLPFEATGEQTGALFVIVMPILAILGSLMISLPVAGALVALVAPVMHLAWTLWHNLMRPSPTTRVTWTGSALRTSDGQHLAFTDDVEVVVAYDKHGTQLVARRGEEELRIRGEHRYLVPLAETLWERRSITDDGRAEMLQALKGVERA